jgi:hypothetical protein
MFTQQKQKFSSIFTEEQNSSFKQACKNIKAGRDVLEFFPNDSFESVQDKFLDDWNLMTLSDLTALKKILKELDPHVRTQEYQKIRALGLKTTGITAVMTVMSSSILEYPVSYCALTSAAVSTALTIGNEFLAVQSGTPGSLSVKLLSQLNILHELCDGAISLKKTGELPIEGTVAKKWHNCRHKIREQVRQDNLLPDVKTEGLRRRRPGGGMGGPTN